ncbi:MAG: flagellar biosynthetic protein FliO [bacterium]
MARLTPLARRSALVAFLTITLARPALAGETMPGVTESALRSLAALGAVLGLILLLAWFLRRLRESTPARSDAPRLTSLGRLDLGSRREVRLVRVADRVLVLGVTEQRLELLTEIAPAGLETAAPDAEMPIPELGNLRKLARSA